MNLKQNIITSCLPKLWNKLDLLGASFPKRSISTFYFLLFTFTLIAQESNKKKVLVVPYNRFEFVSEFELSEIAEKNETTTDKVFLLYQQTLLNTFEAFEDENFEFISAKHHLIKPYKSIMKFEMGKFRGKKYNSINLKSFPEKEFEKFLSDHGCDFVIFLTWHDIQKEAHLKSDNRKRVPYAGHYLDYDVFNLFKQRVVGEGRIKAEAPEPNDLEASYALLRTKELAKAYKNFITHVVEQLNNPIQ